MGSTSATENPPAPPAPPRATKPPEVLAPDLTRGTALRERSAPYWVGVIGYAKANAKKGVTGRDHPPMHSVDLGGITFPEKFTPWEGGEGEEEEAIRGRYMGAVVHLTETRVAKLKEALKRTLIRWRERKGRHAHGYKVTLEDDAAIEEARKRWGLNEAQVANLKAKASQQQLLPTDEPIGKYLYCVKLDGDHEEGTTWRPHAGVPKCVLETGIEAP